MIQNIFKAQNKNSSGTYESYKTSLISKQSKYRTEKHITDSKKEYEKEIKKKKQIK